MASQTPDNADVFVLGESFAYLRGKESPLTADVFTAGEAQGVLFTTASVKTVAPAVSSVAAVSCSLVRVRARTAAVSSTATVTCSVVRVRARSASVASTATVSCSLRRVRARSASVSSAATVSCALVRVRARAASVASAAVVSCSLVRVRARSAAVSSTSTVSCSLHRLRARAASVSSTATVSCSLRRVRARSAAVSSTATVTCTLHKIAPLVLETGECGVELGDGGGLLILGDGDGFLLLEECARVTTAGGPPFRRPRRKVVSRPLELYPGAATVSVWAYAPLLEIGLVTEPVLVSARAYAAKPSLDFPVNHATVGVLFRAERDQHSADLDEEFARLVEEIALLTG